MADDDWDIPLEATAVTASAREPFAHEAATDFTALVSEHQSTTTQALARLAPVLDRWRALLRQQIITGLRSGDTLPDLNLDTLDGAAVLTRSMTEFAQRSGQEMQREAERQGVQIPEWHLPEDVTAALGGHRLLSSVAKMTSDLIAGSMIQTAKRVLTGFLASPASPEQVAADVDTELADHPGAKGAVDQAMSAARNTGRQAVLTVAPPATYYASELMDDRTCGPCRTVDGERFGSLEIALKAYPVSGYKDCLGSLHGHACRGMIIADWTDAAQTASAATMRADALQGGTMPWHVAKSNECGTSEPWAVIKETTGEVEGCHATQAEANDQMAALYAAEGGGSMGGKPSKGTKKDKRLTENQYAADGHFGPSNSVSDAPWNGAASNFTDEQYQRAAAACDPGNGTPKERCFLPHHTPEGSLSRAGLGAAAGRSSQLPGRDAGAVARAKAHLRGHYKAIKEPVPDNLKATDEEIESFGVEEGYEEIVFAAAAEPVKPKGGKCPPGMEMGPDGMCMQMANTKVKCPPGMTPNGKGGCTPSESSGGPHKPQKNEDETVAMAELSDTTAPWRGPLTVEGIETGDGRQFDTESLTWADLPLPLRWNKEDSHGGEPHTVAVNVGRIDKIWREDNGLIMGEGLLDLGTEDGQTVQQKIKGKFIRGVSVDVDSVKDADMELVWPEDPDGEGGDDLFGMLFANPEKVIFHKGRIRGATVVDIPAFAEAYIALLDDEGAVTAGGEPIGALRAATAPRHPDLSVTVPVRPPAGWFADPGLSVLTPITVTQDGRVYGHAAPWGTCHIGQAGVCVTAPQEESHPYFMTGSVLCADGTLAPVGQITLGTGHADIGLGHRAASEHYDNTGTAVADVAVGNDGHGIWVAGAVRPGVPAERIHELRASGQVSGDWRSIGGKLRLVGLLAVNVPGFPVPKLRTRIASGHQFALVAAGQLNLREQFTEDELDQFAYDRILKKIAERIHTKE